MSRFSVAVTLASLLVACGACSKKSDTAQVSNAPGGDPPIRVVDNSAKKGGLEAQQVPNANGMTPENDASYKLAVSPPAAASAGAEAVARVSVTPTQGWHVNKDFPTQLQVTAPDGVTVQKAVMEITDAAKLSDDELSFDIKLKATKAGTYKVDGEIKFAVCTPDSCDPKKRPIAIELVAQ